MKSTVLFLMVQNMINDFSPLLISLKTSLVATFFAFIFGSALAVLIYYYNGKFKTLLDSLIILPIILPPTVIGFILLLILGRNGPLQFFNINILFTWKAAVIAATVSATPLMYRSFLSSLNDLDTNYIYVAKTLGASKFKILSKIIFPLCKTGILTGIVLAFARALGEFGATVIIASNIKGVTQTIPLVIYFEIQSGNNLAAALWVLILVFVSLVILFILNKKLSRKYF